MKLRSFLLVAALFIVAVIVLQIAGFQSRPKSGYIPVDYYPFYDKMDI